MTFDINVSLLEDDFSQHLYYLQLPVMLCVRLLPPSFQRIKVILAELESNNRSALLLLKVGSAPSKTDLS